MGCGQDLDLLNVEKRAGDEQLNTFKHFQTSTGFTSKWKLNFR